MQAKKKHCGFETYGRRHQKSKTGISVVPQKGLVSYKNFLIKKTKKQNVTPVSIVPGPQPFGSDALLSELLRHVTWDNLSFVLAPWSMTHEDLTDLKHDCSMDLPLLFLTCSQKDLSDKKNSEFFVDDVTL